MTKKDINRCKKTGGLFAIETDERGDVISAGGQHEHHTITQTRSPRPPAEKQGSTPEGKLQSK